MTFPELLVALLQLAMAFPQLLMALQQLTVALLQLAMAFPQLLMALQQLTVALLQLAMAFPQQFVALNQSFQHRFDAIEARWHLQELLPQQDCQQALAPFRMLFQHPY
jgi:hypothetical protein